MNILITGGAGFIGANFTEYMVKNHPKHHYIVYDKLTYASNLHNLDNVINPITFISGDITNKTQVHEVFATHGIDALVHFAAETHVDNSIKDPEIFTHANVIGTQILLETARKFWGENSKNKFVHISTDEVYGTLGDTGYFTEETPINPSSPYSASKAGSDLIALAYAKTFKMNVTVTNCSNNYGPYQYHEKLIPHMISRALKDEKLPVYGAGNNIRDWLYVEDHCAAIAKVLESGKPGERYNIGGHNEMTNLDIVKLILNYLGKPETLIAHVEDRKGHDYRYAIDPTKIKRELNWEPETKFKDGIKKTIDWYLNHPEYLD